MQQFTASTEQEGRGLVVVARGVISGEQLLRQTRKTYAPDVVQRLRYQIIDLRDVERMDITAEQMKQLASLNRQAAEAAAGAKIAIVACHDLTVGLSRIYSAYAQSPQLQARIFRSMEDARAWVESDEQYRAADAKAGGH